MTTRKLELACPVCGSKDVVYSCVPSCCFNHVCGACRASFQPVTRPAGGRVSGVEGPDPRPDSGDPTVACAMCGSTDVFLADDFPVCAHCGAKLILEFTEISS